MRKRIGVIFLSLSLAVTPTMIAFAADETEVGEIMPETIEETVVETKAETIKQNMVKQLYSPVQFIKSTEWLIDQGVDHFIEIGPGKVLSGLIKKINRDVKITSIQTLEDVKGWNNHDE